MAKKGTIKVENKTAKKKIKKHAKTSPLLTVQTLLNASEPPTVVEKPASISPAVSNPQVSPSFHSEPAEEADCYLGIHYKILGSTSQNVKIAIWNKTSGTWVQMNVQIHPHLSAEARDEAVRRALSDLSTHPSTRIKQERYYLA